MTLVCATAAGHTRAHCLGVRVPQTTSVAQMMGGSSPPAGVTAMDHIRAVAPDTIVRGDGGDIESAVRALLAQGVAAAKAMDARTQSAAGTAKAGGEFTFGDQDDFVHGLQGLIGLPDGLDETRAMP